MLITDLPYFENILEDSVSVQGGGLFEASATVNFNVNLSITLPTSYSVLQSASTFTEVGDATANASNSSGNVGNPITVTLG